MTIGGRETTTMTTTRQTGRRPRGAVRGRITTTTSTTTGRGHGWDDVISVLINMFTLAQNISIQHAIGISCIAYVLREVDFIWNGKQRIREWITRWQTYFRAVVLTQEPEEGNLEKTMCLFHTFPVVMSLPLESVSTKSSLKVFSSHRKLHGLVKRRMYVVDYFI